MVHCCAAWDSPRLGVCYLYCFLHSFVYDSFITLCLHCLLGLFHVRLSICLWSLCLCIGRLCFLGASCLGYSRPGGSCWRCSILFFLLSRWLLWIIHLASRQVLGFFSFLIFLLHFGVICRWRLLLPVGFPGLQGVVACYFGCLLFVLPW